MLQVGHVGWDALQETAEWQRVRARTVGMANGARYSSRQHNIKPNCMTEGSTLLVLPHVDFECSGHGAEHGHKEIYPLSSQNGAEETGSAQHQVLILTVLSPVLEPASQASREQTHPTLHFTHSSASERNSQHGLTPGHPAFTPPPTHCLNSMPFLHPHRPPMRFLLPESPIINNLPQGRVLPLLTEEAC